LAITDQDLSFSHIEEEEGVLVAVVVVVACCEKQHFPRRCNPLVLPICKRAQFFSVVTLSHLGCNSKSSHNRKIENARINASIRMAANSMWQCWLGGFIDLFIDIYTRAYNEGFGGRLV
jgi:hypothetical protein